MRIDIDTYKEILDTLTRNKGRTFLTGFGVFWGIFMLVALMGGGNGLEDTLARNFEGFATNSAMIWSQQTTKPFKGFRKGRWWTMDTNDIERLKRGVPELDVVAPVLFSSKQLRRLAGHRFVDVHAPDGVYRLPARRPAGLYLSLQCLRATAGQGRYHVIAELCAVGGDEFPCQPA